jgi:hypothetical protein
MTGISSYSTTASENVQANTGIDWDEGMSPGQVNNSARQNMADIRAAFDDLIWFQYGIGSKAVNHAYASTTSTTIAGADVTAVYHAKRRVKAVGASTGTIYGSITSSSYAGSTTTVNYVWDSGALANETLTIYLSQVPVTGNPAGLPVENRYTDFSLGSSYSPSLTTSFTPQVMLGRGGTWTLTPKSTGRVRVRLAVSFNIPAGVEGFLQIRYGTGTAPSQGATASTSGSSAGTLIGVTTPAAGGFQIITPMEVELTGLTLRTAYWFDLSIGEFSGGAATVIVLIISTIIEEF